MALCARHRRRSDSGFTRPHRTLGLPFWGPRSPRWPSPLPSAAFQLAPWGFSTLLVGLIAGGAPALAERRPASDSRDSRPRACGLGSHLSVASGLEFEALKISNGESIDALVSVNRVRITGNQLLRFSDEVQALPKDLAGFVGASFVAAKHARKRPEEAAALIFRMQALAKLIEDEPLPGWTFPKAPDGSITTDQEVFKAAAMEPLIEREGHLVFDRESFTRRVLKIADLNTEG